MLRQIHVAVDRFGLQSTYGYAARSLDSLQEPLTSFRFRAPFNTIPLRDRSVHSKIDPGNSGDRNITFL